jgi:serine/threonine protein kinase|mmetsp:Transcript_3169/g.4469  ORF Transcript_3169/g.4469 Transcript_3169/m.4469 type:complete len:352 (-) Transcript_3169:463-1518(-)
MLCTLQRSFHQCFLSEQHQQHQQHQQQHQQQLQQPKQLASTVMPPISPIALHSDPASDFHCGATLMKTLYGKVKKATRFSDGQIVAIKLSKLELVASRTTKKGVKVLENPEVEQAIFKYLANSLDKGVGSNFVIKLLGEGEDDKYKWSIFEYADKGELFAHVTSGGLGVLRSQTLFKQLAQGLAYLHRNHVAHLDLSLENVLLDKNDNVKICDFGMARDVSVSRKCSGSRERPGKVAYMAPEVFAGMSFDAKKADVFSIGVDLFLMLTGVLPFQIPALSDPCFACLTEGRINMLLEHWKLTDRVRPDAADLLSNMFCAEDQRYTIEQVLDHPWVSSHTPPSTPLAKVGFFS